MWIFYVALVSSFSFESDLAAFKKDAGLSIRTLSGERVFGYRDTELYAPASVAKVISTACVLNTVGPSYQIETSVGIRGSVVKGHLQGDLVIKGGGDPSFVIENLKEILERVYWVSGITKITGKLILDLSYFGVAELKVADGFEGDDGRSFAAELTALPFNHNSFSIWSTAQPEGARSVILPPRVLDARIQQSFSTPNSSVSALSISFNPNAGLINISGSLGKTAEPRAFYRAHPKPFEALFSQVRRVYQELGGDWQKPALEISLKPVSMQTLWIHRSLPMGRILLDVNKLSTNFAAELSLLAAAAKEFGVPANHAKARSLMQRCIADADIKPTEASLENASGLSRESRISTAALTKFLAAQSKSLYFAEYQSTFSILGLDGTTRSRLPNLAGRARLKTGSLRNVRSIAGYVTAKSGQQYVFAFMVNDSVAEGSIRQLEDRVISELAK